MSAIYNIKKFPDTRWDLFVKECKQRGLKTDSGDKMVEELAVFLKEYHGKINVNDESSGAWSWLHSLEFDSEEDLTYFKLKFN